MLFTDVLVNHLGGKLAFKSIQKRGTMIEFSIPIDNRDYVSPVFDEDIEKPKNKDIRQQLP